MAKLTWTPTENSVRILAQLKLNQGNIAQTARTLGVSRLTVRRYRDANLSAAEQVQQKAERAKRDAQVKAAKQEAIAEDVAAIVRLSVDKLEELATELCGSLLADLRDPKLKWPFRDRAWTFGVVFDKMQVAKGQPTSINQTIGSLSEEERARKAQQLLDRARQRRLNAGGNAMGIVEEQKDGTTG